MATWIYILGLTLIICDEGLATKVAPVITCHDDFNVTITTGSWELIAVEGYELKNATDPECISQARFGALHFDIQRHCQDGYNTMKIFNNTYTFTIRARQEWLLETSEDRLIEMKCEYHLTGEGDFEQPVSVQQDFTVAPTVAATQATTISGARLLLVNDRDDRDGPADKVWKTLDAAQVGQKVRLVVDTTTTPTHPQYPFIGVIGCYFSDREGANAMRFTMINSDGCANPPSYYDPFKAGGTPFVNGMLLNKKPVDDANTSPSADPVNDATGYLTGEEEAGVAYSDIFKVFKFPGTTQVYAKCKIRFCVEKTDPDCITPNCNDRLYTGLYSLGGYNTVYKRKKRSVRSGGVNGEDEEEEEEKRKGEVGEIGFVFKIVDGGERVKQISASNSDLMLGNSEPAEMDQSAMSCSIEYYILIAICILLGIAIMGSMIAWLMKKSQQKEEDHSFLSSSTYLKH